MLQNDLEHISSCEKCVQFKQPQEREEMTPISTSYPLELVHLDFLTIGHGDKTANVLVVTDHFTRYIFTGLCSTKTDSSSYSKNSMGEFSGTLWVANKHLN